MPLFLATIRKWIMIHDERRQLRHIRVIASSEKLFIKTEYAKRHNIWLNNIFSLLLYLYNKECHKSIDWNAREAFMNNKLQKTSFRERIEINSFSNDNYLCLFVPRNRIVLGSIKHPFLSNPCLFSPPSAQRKKKIPSSLDYQHPMSCSCKQTANFLQLDHPF